jgi:hypothetical protein
VLLVQLSARGGEDRKDVLPLTFRNFATTPVPLQLSEDRVFWALEEDRTHSFGADNLSAGAAQLLGIERCRTLDEEVDLERRQVMDGVERTPARKRLRDSRTADIELRLQGAASASS